MTTEIVRLERATLYRGDTLHLLDFVEDGSVDALITDPPYSSGGAFRGDRMAKTSVKYQQTGTAVSYGEFAGDNRDQRAYGFWLTMVSSLARSKVREGGAVCIFTDWRQIATTIDAMQAGGFVYRGLVAWHKPAARPNIGRFTASCEFIVWGSAGGMKSYPGAPAIEGMCTAHPSDKQHIAGKPVALMQHLCRIVRHDGLVFDPFMGSATTGVAALQQGHRFVGFEIDPTCFAGAAARLRDVDSQQTLPLEMVQESLVLEPQAIVDGRAAR